MILFEAKVGLLPLTVNRLYLPRGRHKVMTREGRAFLQEFDEQLKDFDFDPIPARFPLALELTFLFPVLENSGFPARAKNRFKRRDVSNMIKVAEDGVCAYLGIDDSQFVQVTARKKQGGPATWIRVSTTSI